MEVTNLFIGWVVLKFPLHPATPSSPLATPSIPPAPCHSHYLPLPLPQFPLHPATPSIPPAPCHSLNSSCTLPLPLSPLATPSIPPAPCHSHCLPLPLPQFPLHPATPLVSPVPCTNCNDSGAGRCTSRLTTYPC